MIHVACSRDVAVELPDVWRGLPIVPKELCAGRRAMFSRVGVDHGMMRYEEHSVAAMRRAYRVSFLAAGGELVLEESVVVTEIPCGARVRLTASTPDPEAAAGLQALFLDALDALAEGPLP